MKAVPWGKYLLFFALASGGFALDLWTKHWAFDGLGIPSGKVEWVWHGVFGFETSLNEGALFGLGQGWVKAFVVLSFGAVAGILLWLFWPGNPKDWTLTAALGSVTAGVLGNLYDRLGLPGLTWTYATETHAVGDPVYAVRDFILVMIGSMKWPNFNVADMFLVCGAGLLLLHAFFDYRKERAATHRRKNRR
jgi:signal peptidase II